MFAEDPLVPRGIKRLTETADTLNPTLEYVAPAQTTCNYLALFFRNIASLLSEGDRNGTWQRFIIVATPLGPNNEGTLSAAPADGPSAAEPPPHQPLPEHRVAGPAARVRGGQRAIPGRAHGDVQPARPPAGARRRASPDGRRRRPRRRRAGRNPFAVGLIALVVLAILVFLGFTKDIPFTRAARGQGGVRVRQRPAPGLARADRRRRTSARSRRVDGQDGTNNAVVTMEIDDAGLPLHTDATAKIRPRIFLEGNFFVDLRPGTPGAPELDDGDTIKVTQTATPVQLDEVLTSLQSDTRADLQDVLRGDRHGVDRRADGGAEPRRRPVAPAASRRPSRSTTPTTTSGRPSATQSQVNEALLGTEPERDLQRLVSGAARTSAGLARNEVQLKDLVSNFNTTMAALAAEDASLRAARRDPAEHAGDGQRGVQRAQRGLPADARVRDRDPARRARDGRDDRRGVPLDPRHARTARAGGAAGPRRRPRAGRARPRAADRRRRSTSLPQANLLSRCARDVLLPTGDVVIRDEFSTGRENYKELFYSMVGLAGEGQNFDGNGMYVRFQTGGGTNEVSVGRSNLGNPPQFGALPIPPLGNRPAYPGRLLGLQARRAVLPPAAAGPQRAGGGAHPPGGTVATAATAGRARALARLRPTLEREGAAR